MSQPEHPSRAASLPAGTVLPARSGRPADGTLTDRLARAFELRIRERLLAPGARLPSVRECARRHGVSPHTVVAAYDRLLALGLVEARRQRGFYVRDDLRDGTARPDVSAVDRFRRDERPPPSSPLPISATALIRGMLQPADARPMPGLGTLPVDWLDTTLLARALRRVAGSGLAAVSLQYGEPAGNPRLRSAVAAQLAGLGIPATPAQVISTVGATQALDIVTRSYAPAGATVLVDEPGWAVEYARLRALGLGVLPVPRGLDGPDLDAMQRLIDAQAPGRRPRLYITVSVLHNPTGASLSLQAAHRVLSFAQANDLRVVEDDTYAHLAPPHLPRIAALDGLERTIYISGYSKILVPNWRVGFIAAPAAEVERLVDTKLLTTLASPALTELALAHCLEEGWLRRHAERVVARLAVARARTVRLAEAHGCRFATPPCGLFGWVDVGVDTERLAQMLHEAWLIAPGALFHATPRPTHLMRINFATSHEPRFWEAVVRARERLDAGGASPGASSIVATC